MAPDRDTSTLYMHTFEVPLSMIDSAIEKARAFFIDGACITYTFWPEWMKDVWNCDDEAFEKIRDTGASPERSTDFCLISAFEKYQIRSTPKEKKP